MGILLDMRTEVNLADNSEDHNGGFGPIFSSGPCVALPGGSVHDTGSCERQEMWKLFESDTHHFIE